MHADFENEDALQRLRRERAEVVGTFASPPMGALVRLGTASNYRSGPADVTSPKT